MENIIVQEQCVHTLTLAFDSNAFRNMYALTELLTWLQMFFKQKYKDGLIMNDRSASIIVHSGNTELIS